MINKNILVEWVVILEDTKFTPQTLTQSEKKFKPCKNIIDWIDTNL